MVNGKGQDVGRGVETGAHECEDVADDGLVTQGGTWVIAGCRCKSKFVLATVEAGVLTPQNKAPVFVLVVVPWAQLIRASRRCGCYILQLARAGTHCAGRQLMALDGCRVYSCISDRLKTPSFSKYRITQHWHWQAGGSDYGFRSGAYPPNVTFTSVAATVIQSVFFAL